MEFIEVAKAAGELGILLLCGGLVVIIFWLTYKRSAEREDELINSMQKQNETLVKEIVNKITKHTMSEEDTFKMAQIDDEIVGYLKRTQEMTGANRVSIMMYHNGGNDSIGNPFPRMSMRYEVTNGVPRVMEQMKNMFKSYLHEWCKLMDTRQYYEVPDLIEAEKVSGSFAEFMKLRNIEALSGIAIRNENKSTVGFIIIEYKDKNDVKIDQVRHCLHDKQLKIEALLGLER